MSKLMMCLQMLETKTEITLQDKLVMMINDVYCFTSIGTAMMNTPGVAGSIFGRGVILP